MNEVENMNICKRLLCIQTELKAPKSQFNSFGKYNYRSCEDILEAVKPLCAKYGTVLQISDGISQVGERYYVTATAILTSITDGGFISVTGQAREEESKKGMDSSQVTGAASSYARKYALNGLFCIDDTKDSDATNTGNSTAKSAEKCADCGAEITSVNKNNGEPWAVADMLTYSQRKFNRKLCAACMKKAQDKRKQGGNT
jgi:hypothetical protein